MKLRSITLRNVRRFAGREVQLCDFSDGLSTVCEPNETGKSTVFDALHALLFADHKSATQEIKSLQPYAGGAVHVGAEVELEGGRFRIEKTFLSSKKARITEVAKGRVLAQEGEAEAWITESIGRKATGPAGLLWVRQGVAGFGPEGSGPREKGERERLRVERRELMSTVAGQVDMVTGGRRMDKIMQRCIDELETLVTPSRFAPRANGPWGAQDQEVKTLEERRSRLATQLRDLGDALTRKGDLSRSLERLADPEAARLREADIAKARADFDAAKEHAEQVAAAEQKLRLLQLEAKEPRGQLERAEVVARQRQDLTQRIIQLSGAQDTALARHRDCVEDLQSAQAIWSAALDARDSTLQAVREARRAAALAGKRQELAAALRRHQQISALEGELAAALKVARDAPLDAKGLARLDDLERRRALAQARREAGAPSFTMSYEGGARARTASGKVDGDIEYAVLKETTLQLPGIGQLTLRPGLASTQSIEAEPDDLARELARELGALGLGDLAAARVVVDAAQAAVSNAKQIRTSINTIAPEGTEALRMAIKELGAALDLDADALLSGEGGWLGAGNTQEEGRDELETKLDTLEGDLRRAQASLEEVRRAEAKVSSQLTEAKTELRVAREELDRAPAELDHQAVDSLRKLLSEKEEAVGAAQAELEAKRSTSADLAFAEAALKRLESVKANNDEHVQQTRDELNKVEGIIAARAEAGVEEKLAEVEGALERAQARWDRYQVDARALKELKEALEAARTQARDIYFEPVRQEIAPLIRALHGNANFEMDDATMLLSRLERGGEIDNIDVLSSGAAEQIAILTRLAFARLYAKNGQHLPVILDDPLSNTDDQRIETMFSLLTQIARDQQIIVFSCHDRAFASLGGRRVRIRDVLEVAS